MFFCSLLFDFFFLFNVFGSYSENSDHIIKQPMVEMILLNIKLMSGQTFSELTEMCKLFVYVTGLQRLQKS